MRKLCIQFKENSKGMNLIDVFLKVASQAITKKRGKRKKRIRFWGYREYT